MVSSPSPAPAPAAPASARRLPRRPHWQTIRSLLPYLWPKNDMGARARVSVAMLFLVAAKGATVLLPVVYGRAVDALAPKGAGAALAVPVALILGYGLLRVASSGFAELRDAVFAAVQQRATRRVALRTFRHLHALSLRYHLDRQTGGLARVIDRGTLGIQSVLRLAVFNVVPTVFEIAMVTAILWALFDWRFALLTFIAVGLYLAFTLLFTNARVRIRRRMNESDNEARAKSVDSLLNYETVKYFGNEAHEAARFDRALASYEKAAVRSQVSLNMLNLGQAGIIAVGLSGIMLLAARGVASGHMTVGNFVVVNTYLMQLYQPLNFLGFVYREIKQGLVDMEHMFDLLGVPAEVADRPGAPALAAPAGEVRFEAVRFGYRPDREILKGVDFTVPAGRKLAIVGPTGAGKSTISRLLFRFYDPTGGRILVDGQDIRAVTQASLRAVIGVVPQDTVLFNDTIRYNIAYGRPGASQAEIEHAARLAQVHDFVLDLPDGYETMVGERGLKLSGGEKQRVAIARTILKDPRILILDEATSALDTRTEQEIGTALAAAAAHRTTLVIAHRLSTVVDADEIIVLVDGAVAERGSHASLLAARGVYARMWTLQAMERETDAVAAEILPEEAGAG
ncbi:MAG TPA: ABC transporter ATP-binding protein/permease [Acetobacteraceae bacterium]|nr:ABC transporter ATP-binding protein/permease [Acetobacteraceae bacterium]